MNPLRNVLICRTDRIGDVVLTLPLARALKETFPGCRVAFLVRDYTRPLLQGHPFVDEIHVARERAGKMLVGENAHRLRARGFDCAIAVFPTPRIAASLVRAGIPRRIGTRYRWYSPLFTDRVDLHRRDTAGHELEHNFRLLEPLGHNLRPTPETIRFDLTPSTQALAEVRRVLREAGIASDRPFVVAHPGSGGSAADLPLSKLRELVTGLAADGIPVVVTGTAAEQSLARVLSERSPGVSDLSGRFDLAQLTACLSLASLVIANSTGPIHIAAGLGRPVLGFYPRARSCGADRWGPYSPRSRVFTPRRDCAGCVLEDCRRNACMETVNLVEARQAALELLGQAS